MTSVSGAHRTRSVSATATHGRIRPSAFSSALTPGHSIRYEMRPLIKRHKHVRQAPLRHDLGSRRCANAAASSSDREAGASNVCPFGSIRTIGLTLFLRNWRAFCRIKCRFGPRLQGKLARMDKSSTVYAIGVDGMMSVLAARASSKKEALPPARLSACFRHGKGEVHADQFS